MRLLLEHGAHAHQISRNPQRNQALHAAIALGDSVETILLLLEAGADVNATQAGGFTPLHQAAAAGKLDVVALLLENGARRDAACDQGKKPGDYARGARPCRGGGIARIATPFLDMSKAY